MPSLLVDTSTDGATLVAAPAAGCFIRVIGLDLTSSGQVVVSLKSNTTEKWKTNAMDNSSGVGGIVIPTGSNVTIDCVPGEALKIGLSASVAVRGSLEYIVLGRQLTN